MKMEPWLPFIVIVSVFLSLVLKHILFQNKKRSLQLPPGPSSIPMLKITYHISKSMFDIFPILRDLSAKYGGIFTLCLISKPSIFIADRVLAHQALIHQSATFANRPPVTEPTRIISCNLHNISSAPYGPLWRVLRRNLTSEILHPSRIKHFVSAREWVLRILLDKLKVNAESSKGVVTVVESFQYAMFCLLVFMCFGEKLDEKEIREIESAQTALHKWFPKFNILAFLPKITKVLFRSRWKMLLEIRRKQAEVFVPLIRRRGENRQRGFGCSYVDSLLDLSIPKGEGGERRLTEEEIVSLCSEFLSAGADTTSTALEWIMAELVINEEVQTKVSEEIDRVIPMDEEIKEEDLQKLQYLKAVIFEGLRKHPPGQLLAAHAVTEDTEIGGFVVPKNASVDFMVGEIARDERVWNEPMKFKPERFLNGGEGEDVDITGTREIKLLPFGAGRRICPGLGLTMLHLEYFVGNLVREFEWNTIEGEEVDLSEKLEIAVGMKNHLRARITPRRAKNNTQ